MISVEIFPKGQDSSKITNLFVFFTEAKMVLLSSGLIVLKSIISQSILSLDKISAALNASLIILP